MGHENTELSTSLTTGVFLKAPGRFELFEDRRYTERKKREQSRIRHSSTAGVDYVDDVMEGLVPKEPINADDIFREELGQKSSNTVQFANRFFK